MKFSAQTAFFCLAAIIPQSPVGVYATPGIPGSVTRNETFLVPPKLRPRVNFWIDIFAKYGKNQSVIHHREFPQVVFNVLDFDSETREMSGAAAEKFRKKRVESEISELRSIFRKLSKGLSPENEYERHVAAVMSPLGEGLAGYKRVLDDDLLRSQTGIKERYAEAVRRSGRYLPLMEDIFVREFKLPIELTRLPFVESSFDYQAYSSAGAAGIWQFMPRTGRIYMSVNNIVDERRDAIESTRAAARYLLQAHSQIGNWPLALTSYNHGIGGVLKKVKKAGTMNITKLIEGPGERPFGFASSNFYPEFLAALEIYDNLKHYFPEVQLEPPLRIYQHPLPQPVSASYLLKMLEIEEEQLKALNPALSKLVWSGRYKIPTGYVLKVPQELEAKLTVLKIPEPRTQVVAPAASSVYGGNFYRVRSGDTLIRIAHRYGTSVARLRELNSLSSDNLRVGQLLLVSEKTGPRPTVAISGAVVTKPAATLKEAPGERKKYTVKKGDSLYSIALQHKTTVFKLREVNHLKSTKLKIGQVLVIE